MAQSKDLSSLRLRLTTLGISASLVALNSISQLTSGQISLSPAFQPASSASALGFLTSSSTYPKQTVALCLSPDAQPVSYLCKWKLQPSRQRPKNRGILDLPLSRPHPVNQRSQLCLQDISRTRPLQVQATVMASQDYCSSFLLSQLLSLVTFNLF